MDIRTKINFKKYLLYSIPSTALCVYLARSIEEIFAISLAYGVTVLNHAMLVYGVSELLNPAYVERESERPTRKIILAFIGKLIFLAGGLIFCEMFMGRRVIIPVVNYVILIFVLYASIEKKVSK